MQALTYESSPSSRLAEQHSLGLSTFLHLAPGVLTGLVYFLLAGPVTRLGLPSLVALMASGILVIIPWELGVIAWAAAAHRPAPLSFWEMLPYGRPMPWWKYLVLVPVLLVAAGLLFSLAGPITAAIQSQFSWLPAAAVLNMGMQGSFPKSVLIGVTVANALLIGILLPVVEELYFRGFLLPRLPARLNGWTPLVNSFLFAAYHTWSPWMIIARTVGLLPMIYFVRRERNILLGILVHCLANLIDVAAMATFLANLP